VNKNVRLMTNNFIGRGFSSSSEVSEFAAANIYNPSRSKIWKPAGNFEVTALNNKIYVNDGSDKTITLTVGSYLYGSLATHIQTQLNASSSNWTCVYDSSLTYKFTLARSSGTAVLKKTVTTNASWDMLGYVGETDLSVSPFIADEQRNHTSEWVKYDLGVPQELTFFALLSGIDEIFPLSESAVVRIQANNIDYWVSPPVDEEVPVTSLGCFSVMEDLGSYRYGRMEIIDRLNYLGPEGLRLAVAYIGDHQTVTATNIARGFSKELNDPSIALQSENGATFFQTRPRFLSIGNCVIQLLNGQEQRDIEQLFYDVGVRTPFFVSIDPGVEVSQDLEELTRYMIMTRAPKLNHVFRNYYDLDWDMKEAF